jgi:hypothetical protein
VALLAGGLDLALPEDGLPTEAEWVSALKKSKKMFSMELLTTKIHVQYFIENVLIS